MSDEEKNELIELLKIANGKADKVIGENKTPLKMVG